MQGRYRIREIAEKIGRTQQACGLKEAVGDFVDQFRFELVEVVYEWAKGMVICLQRIFDVRSNNAYFPDSLLPRSWG